jgi:hypothetical protein
MSHSPTAQFGQGTVSGRRTIPTTRSPFLNPEAGPGSSTRPSDSCPNTSRDLPGGAPAVFAFHNLDISSAHANGNGFHEHRAVPWIRLGDIFPPCSPWFLWFNSNRFHFVTFSLVSFIIIHDRDIDFVLVHPGRARSRGLGGEISDDGMRLPIGPWSSRRKGRGVGGE